MASSWEVTSFATSSYTAFASPAARDLKKTVDTPASNMCSDLVVTALAYVFASTEESKPREELAAKSDSLSTSQLSVDV